MTAGDGVLEYRRLRAPREHGGALIDPPLDRLPELVAENASRARQESGELLGRSRAQLSEAARQALLDSARRYTAGYRDVADLAPLAGHSPILLTGHQPQLFHPGVWLKNFVSWRLAQRLSAHAVHLLIDNDILASASIRVPAGSVAAPTLEQIALDRAAEPVPYEERGVLDGSVFESFAQRASRTLRPLIRSPLVGRIWPAAVAAGRRTGNLGRAVAQARHQLEGQWGVSTCEVPLSQLCEADPFRWFVAHLLAELPRFFEIYNDSLGSYRAVNRIRSRSHPVPELGRVGEWLEAPFWMWSIEDPHRRRLFVRRAARQLELSDRAGRTLRVAEPGMAGAEKTVGQLAESSAQGIRIRPRALITTMYARLFLSDLFLHGIGGAKYDQLTDLIIRRFFGWEPPAFVVVTATVTLPIERPRVAPAELRGVERELRELEFHPERYVPVTAETEPLLAEKRRWIAARPPHGQGRQRHLGITQANHALQPFLVDRHRELCDRRGRIQELLRHERLLGSREYSFCLYPEETLRPFLLDF